MPLDLTDFEPVDAQPVAALDMSDFEPVEAALDMSDFEVLPPPTTEPAGGATTQSKTASGSAVPVIEAPSAVPIEPAPLEIGARFVKGMAQSTAQAVGGAARLAKLAKPVMPVGGQIIPSGAWDDIADFAKDVQDSAAQVYKTDPRGDERLISKVAQGAGSIVPIIASGPLAIATGGAMAGEAARQEAEAAGATEGQQEATLALNAVTGAITEKLLGVPALLRSAKAAGLTGPGVVAGIRSAVEKVAGKVGYQTLASGLREGGQEFLQQVAQNAIAKWGSAFDPNRNIFAGGWENFLVGTLVGGPLGAGVQVAQNIDTRRSAKPAAAAGAPVTEPTIDVIPPDFEPIAAEAEAAGAPMVADALRQIISETPQPEIANAPEIQSPDETAPVEEQPIVSPTEGQIAAGTAQREGQRAETGAQPVAAPILKEESRTDPDFRDQAVAQLKEILSGFPAVWSDLKAITFDKTDIGSADVSQRMPSEGGGLELHFSRFISRGKPSSVKTSGATVSNDFTGLIRHEAGHLIHNFIRAKLNDEGKTELFNYTKTAPLVSGYSKKHGGEAVSEIADLIFSGTATAEQKAWWDGFVEFYRKNIPAEAPPSLGAQPETVGSAPSTPATEVARYQEIQAQLSAEVARGGEMNPELVRESEEIKKRVPIEALAAAGSEGPGAASATEELVSYEPRKFAERFQETKEIAPEIREETGNRYYEPISNIKTVAEAEALIDERGMNDAQTVFRDNNAPISERVRVTLGQGLLKKQNAQYRAAKAAGDTATADLLLNDTVLNAERLSEIATLSGQAVQAFAIWDRLTPEGTLLSFKRSVNKARTRQSEKAPGEVDEILETLNSDVSDKEKLVQLKNLSKKNGTARKVKSKLQKLVELAKGGKLNEEAFYGEVSDKLGLPTFDKDVAAKITDLASKVEEQLEGLGRDRAIRDLNKFIASQRGFDPSDLPIGVFYGNILSGYNTNIVNSLDTFLNVMSEVTGLAISNPRAAAKIYGGLLRGFSAGRFDYILALTEGRMVTDGKWLEVPRLMEVAEFGQKGGVPIKTGTVAGKVAKSVAESKPATVLNAWKYVTRALAASDAIMFRGAKEARASLLAYKLAKDEGLSGDVLEKRAREILALDRIEDFEAQAKEEGFTGTDAQVRAMELREKIRDEGLNGDAADWAGEATYNHQPRGTLGTIAESVGQLTNKVPALKIFVPFTRIVANVTNRGLNWTPYGYKRAAFGFGFGANAEPLTSEQRTQMLARATLGTAGLVALGAMQAAGLLAIHGAGPRDPEKRKQLKAAGWKPYSIQIGDTFITYNYVPVGLGLSIIGNMSDPSRYGEMEDEEAATRAAYSVARVGSTIFSQSFLSGLTRLFGALSESPGTSISAVRQTLSNTAGAFTTPNLIRDIQKFFDPKAYQANTLSEDLLKNTPFAALALKPALNAFGEPINLDRQRFVGKLTGDPVWRTVIDLKVRVPMPSRSTEMPDGKGGKRQITPEEYYRLIQMSGPKVKAWINRNSGALSRMTADKRQDELSQAAGEIRRAESKRLRR